MKLNILKYIRTDYSYETCYKIAEHYFGMSRTFAVLGLVGMFTWLTDLNAEIFPKYFLGGAPILVLILSYCFFFIGRHYCFKADDINNSNNGFNTTSES